MDQLGRKVQKVTRVILDLQELSDQQGRRGQKATLAPQAYLERWALLARKEPRVTKVTPVLSDHKV